MDIDRAYWGLPDPLEATYRRKGKVRSKINTALPRSLAELIQKGVCTGEMAQDVVERALWCWDEECSRRKDILLPISGVGIDLDNVMFEGYLGENVEKDIQQIARVNPDRRILYGKTLPYTIRRVSTKGAKSLRVGLEGVLEGKVEVSVDEDLWILENEKFLRQLRHGYEGIPLCMSNDRFGLVRVEDLVGMLDLVPVTCLENLETVAWTLERSPLKVGCFSILTDKQRKRVFMNPSDQKFHDRFHTMTGGILEGLNWDNVFVAGGMVLGTLVSPDITGSTGLSDLDLNDLSKPEEWESSDIDLYIYGLGSEDANLKIRHIADTYQRNLGSDKAPFLAVRNSQTVTLYSTWPTRRVQIVLKLVRHPREVLLNFDLDVCCVGWDGERVWMLPRFVRALETGTNVFTVDLINGHYLGERRATRDARLFKYADRGYGLRWLDKYNHYLDPYKSSHAKHLLEEIARNDKLCDPPLDMNLIAYASRKWTSDVVQRYKQVGLNERTPREPPRFEHDMLEGYGQITSEPLGRSCLTGLHLLMRHVALWEMDQRGEIKLGRSRFASETYENAARIGYDDTPMYNWDSEFEMGRFKEAIESFNTRQKMAMEEEWHHLKDDYTFRAPPIKRVTYTDKPSEIFSRENDPVLHIFLPSDFLQFAEGLLEEAIPGVKLFDSYGSVTEEELTQFAE
ncbi:hypothetical protein F5880DRAFT_1619170, partial [Lentinula raphanica]